MKKYALLLGLAATASLSFGQITSYDNYRRHHHDQDATIIQFMALNTASINQAGENQEAFIQQVGVLNGARIVQKGEEAKMEAGIMQFGFHNYASIKQISYDQGPTDRGGYYHNTEGFILQNGMYNLAAVKQEKGSEVGILQFGNDNVVASLRFFNPSATGYATSQFSNNNTPFRNHRHSWRMDRDDLRTPFPFASAEVGEGAHLNVKQIHNKNMFIALGELEGNIDVNQHGYKNFLALGQEGRHAESDLTQHGYKNIIFLYNDHGDVNINQRGSENFVALGVGENEPAGMSYSHGYRHHNSEVDIDQFGHGNKVAYYEDICDRHADGPAVFQGDELKVVQVGMDNKVSLMSESPRADVTIFQFGYKNYATVKQTTGDN